MLRMKFRALCILYFSIEVVLKALELSHIHFTILGEVVAVNIECGRAFIIQILYFLFHLHEFPWR